jgi:hypothetical protein
MPTVATKMNELFQGRDRARLLALRQKDPGKSLAERWKKILAGRPDLARRRLGYVPLIMAHRWAVIAIPEEGFAYTIGLRYHFGQPEILLAAQGLAPEELKQILNAIGQYVALGNRIGPREPVDLEDFGISLVFRTYSQQVFERYATGYLATFEAYFEDHEHLTGDTLPVLWAELVPARRRRTLRPAKAKPKRAGGRRERRGRSGVKSARHGPP